MWDDESTFNVNKYLCVSFLFQVLGHLKQMAELKEERKLTKMSCDYLKL